MIDIDKEVFDAVKKAVVKVSPNAFVVGEYVRAPEQFPCVALIEKDSYAVRETQTNASNENHAHIMYELSVYSNRKAGKKAECKKLAAAADAALAKLGFSRTMLNPVPNLDDASIYRLVGRYSAVVSTDNVIYRR